MTGDPETDEETPWFIRPVEEEEDEADAPEPSDFAAAWEAAEGALAPELTETAHCLGRLEERFRLGAPEARFRAREAADLLWSAGHGVRSERLALYLQDGDARGEGKGLSLGVWALRRLEAPLESATVENLRIWLGRRSRGEAAPADLVDVMPMAQGGALDAAMARVVETGRKLEGRSPLARAGAMAFTWGREADFGQERELAASLLGARLAGPEVPGFAPLALGSTRGGLRLSGKSRGPEGDLRAWLAALTGAASRALLDLDALAAWRLRAEAFAHGIQGKGATALVDPLYQHLALNVTMAAELSDISRASAERALVKYEAEGLVREITGAAKWRWWTARV